MRINTYVSSSILSIIIDVNGVSRRVSFGDKMGGGSSYKTSSKDVIEAMEKHNLFNDVFFKTTSCEIDDEPPIDDKSKNDEPKKNDKFVSVEEVNSCSGAIDYLKDKGVIVKPRSKDGIIAAATEIGILFPNLK